MLLIKTLVSGDISPPTLSKVVGIKADLGISKVDSVSRNTPPPCTVVVERANDY